MGEESASVLMLRLSFFTLSDTSIEFQNQDHNFRKMDSQSKRKSKIDILTP
jgi:hypothetical protein